VTFREFTVTITGPVDERVTVCVAGLLTTTAPKEMALAFTLRTGAAAFNWSDNVRETLPVVAVNVTDSAVLTDDTFAENVALVAAAGTKTTVGTETALLLLDRATFKPPFGAGPES